jgi:MoaA/NifB/PqqE/SkfB family radical SAM enzyme
MNTNFKHRCLLPFHHIAIRPNNQVYPCCQFRHESTPQDLHLDHEDVFNHPFMEQLRTSMINDEYVEGCSMCYKQEELSGSKHSMRLDFVRDLGTQIPAAPTLTHIDLALSNVCNNRCRMCNPELSTNWYSDAAKLGSEFFPPVKLSGIKRSKEILEEYDLSNLRYLKLIGGEPLMEEKKFIDLLDRCKLSNLRILLTTNSTIIPSDKLHSLLKQCKVVWVNLSVDAYGDLNSFLRKGSKWQEVTKVIDWFAEHFPGNAKIHGIISIYNINNFYKLAEYIKERHAGKVHVEWQMVDGPNWMQPANLPESVKEKILRNLKGKVGERAYSLVKDEFKNTGNFDLFLDRDSKLNSVRNEDWKELNPELYEMIKDFI